MEKVFGIPSTARGCRRPSKSHTHQRRLASLSCINDATSEPLADEPLLDISAELERAISTSHSSRTAAAHSQLREMLAKQQESILPPVPPRRSKQTVKRAVPVLNFPESSRPLSCMRRMPLDLHIVICEFLGYRELIAVSAVNRTWLTAANTDALWRRIYTDMCRVNGNGRTRTDIHVPVDPWRRAIGVPSDAASHKARVKAYVLATRMRVVAQVDEASEEFRLATDRLAERSRVVERLAAHEQESTESDRQRLTTLTQRAEEALQAHARRGRELEDQEMLLARTLREAKLSLAAIGLQLQSVCAKVDRYADSDRRRMSIESFERKIAALVLKHAPASLPLALRRGIDSFGAVELLALQLTHCTPFTDAWGRLKSHLSLDTGEYWKWRDAYLRGVEDRTWNVPSHTTAKLASLLDQPLESLDGFLAAM